MKTYSLKQGFGIALILGILAVLAIAGGATYVATHEKVDVDTASTSDKMMASTSADVDLRFGADGQEDDMLNGTTSVGAGVNVNLGGAGVGVDVQSSTSASGAMPINGSTNGGVQGNMGY